MKEVQEIEKACQNKPQTRESSIIRNFNQKINIESEEFAFVKPVKLDYFDDLPALESDGGRVKVLVPSNLVQSIYEEDYIELMHIQFLYFEQRFKSKPFHSAFWKQVFLINPEQYQGDCDRTELSEIP